MKKKYFLIFFIFTIGILYSEENPKIGVVLSGGGAKGFAHIGVLKILERENIKIDYIGGTSMGGIIAALYSIGYTVEELENIAINKNWAEVLNDEINRKDLTMKEKIEGKKYFISIPMEDWDLKMPGGLISGQKIEILLHELTWGVFGEKDFKKFPIPFVCLATDIETGEPVELNNGNIVKALRATMSIPTVFNPVQKGNRLLVDGMLSQNFPVENVRKLGADIIIGVDVGKNLSSKKDLNSMVAIMEQAFNLRGIESVNEQRGLTDLLIIPDLGELSSSSFDQGKKLIEIGEKAAEEKIKEIKRYSFKGNKRTRKKIVDLKKVLYIEKLDVVGNNKVDDSYIRQIFNLELPTLLTKEEVTKKIQKLYGTKLFKKVVYDIKNSEIELNVEENNVDNFKLGLNYNDYTKASILMNITLKNGISKQGLTGLDFKLGEYPEVILNYKKYKGIRKKIGISGEIGYSELPYYLYENNKKIAQYDFTNKYIEFCLNSILNKNILLEIGIRQEMITGESKISFLDYEKYIENHMFYYILTKIDTLNKENYPGKGILYEGKLEIGEKELGLNVNYIKLKLKLNTNIPLTKKLTFLNTINLGYLDGESIPQDKYLYVGGIQENDYSMSFYGLQENEIMSKNILIGQIGLQYEFKKDRFLQIKYNRALLNEKIENIIKDMDYIDGIGVVLGANTPLGPVKLGMGKVNSNKYQTYINIGYKF